jgi:peroxiredoxin
MKKVIFLILSIVFFGCDNTNNHKPTQTSFLPVPKDFKRVIPPVFVTDAKEQANFFVTHFWDHFNFRDTMYAYFPNITEQAFVDYIFFFQYASPDRIREGVAKLMKAATADSVMFACFSQLAERYLYAPNSLFRNDEYYIPFLEQIVNSPIISDTYQIRVQYLLNLARKNRPGRQAEDFQYMQANGKQGNLYSVKAEYLLLLFYNPDCEECQNTMEMIQNSTEILSSVENGTLRVLAVYPDENLDKWKEHLEKIPSNWINGYDRSFVLREKEVYDLKAVPTLYLLDRDKQVILKDCSVENINAFFVSPAASR